MSIYNVLQHIEENTAENGGGGGDVNITELAGNAIDLGAGDIESGTLRVCIADDDGAVSLIGASVANLGGGSYVMKSMPHLYNATGNNYVPGHTGTGIITTQTSSNTESYHQR